MRFSQHKHVLRETEGMQEKFLFQKHGFLILKAYPAEESNCPPFQFVCLSLEVCLSES